MTGGGRSLPATSDREAHELLATAQAMIHDTRLPVLIRLNFATIGSRCSPRAAAVSISAPPPDEEDGRARQSRGRIGKTRSYRYQYPVQVSENNSENRWPSGKNRVTRYKVRRYRVSSRADEIIPYRCSRTISGKVSDSDRVLSALDKSIEDCRRYGSELVLNAAHAALPVTSCIESE